MGMPDPPQKIAFAEMRDRGVQGLLVYCADYRCSHSIAISGDGGPDDLRLSDIEERLSAKLAASAVQTQGRISIGIGSISVMGYR
jgi:hypothetical protein